MDKVVASAAEAVSDIGSGSTLAVGGFEERGEFPPPPFRPDVARGDDRHECRDLPQTLD